MKRRKATQKKTRREALPLLDYRQRTRTQATALIGLLQEFIDAHYPEPRMGRYGPVLYAPLIASLQAAASLRALLIVALEAESTGSHDELLASEKKGDE